MMIRPKQVTVKVISFRPSILSAFVNYFFPSYKVMTKLTKSNTRDGSLKFQLNDNIQCLYSFFFYHSAPRIIK